MGVNGGVSFMNLSWNQIQSKRYKEDKSCLFPPGSSVLINEAPKENEFQPRRAFLTQTSSWTRSSPSAEHLIFFCTHHIYDVSAEMGSFTIHSDHTGEEGGVKRWGLTILPCWRNWSLTVWRSSLLSRVVQLRSLPGFIVSVYDRAEQSALWLSGQTLRVPEKKGGAWRFVHTSNLTFHI